jgi:hypothetical protein
MNFEVRHSPGETENVRETSVWMVDSIAEVRSGQSQIRV